MKLAGVFLPSLLAVGLAAAQKTAPDYKQQILQWRKEHEAGLKGERGWLTVAGLFWLHEGDNAIGSADSCPVQLPPPAPAHVGTITLDKDGHATLHVDKGVVVTIKGQPVETATMRSDADEGGPDKAELSGMMFKVIKRGTRYGIRLYDPNAKTLKEFSGLKWFPVDSKYRVVAEFVPYNPPKKIPILNILGDTELDPCPGYAQFKLGGKTFKLDAIDEQSDLFFIIKDETTGETTYPAGRFLYSDMPKNGKVELDFNKAENPPCAFTAYATCPLPPKQNNMNLAIKAGEKKYHEGH